MPYRDQFSYRVCKLPARGTGRFWSDWRPHTPPEWYMGPAHESWPSAAPVCFAGSRARPRSVHALHELLPRHEVRALNELFLVCVVVNAVSECELDFARLVVEARGLPLGHRCIVVGVFDARSCDVVDDVCHVIVSCLLCHSYTQVIQQCQPLGVVFAKDFPQRIGIAVGAEAAILVTALVIPDSADMLAHPELPTVHNLVGIVLDVGRKSQLIIDLGHGDITERTRTMGSDSIGICNNLHCVSPC